MRHRVTFIVSPNYPPELDLSPGSKDYQSNNLHVKSLHAPRQERWTVALSEIPPNVRDLLKPLLELHIRWSTPQAYNSLDPFSCRVPAGLHVHAIPQTGANTDRICSLLSSAFMTRPICNKFDDSFIEVSGDRYYFYAALPELSGEPSPLRGFLKNHICQGANSCKEEIDRLAAPDYIDFDYHAQAQPAQALTISAYWHRSPEEGQDGKWDYKIQQFNEEHRTEIGILEKQKSMFEGKLSFSGLLTVLGENQELKPTLFSVPARHQQHSGTYSGSFKEPSSLHPKFSLKVTTEKPSTEHCSLNAYFSIPHNFFIDRYQLEDEKLMTSLSLRKLKALLGEADLEAPAWTQKRWGTSALFELDPSKVDETGRLDVELPLHLRYQEPRYFVQYTSVKMPWPTVFWACQGQSEAPKYHTNPFERGHLGYDELFPRDTSYHHLSPIDGATYSSVKVPVLDMKHAQLVKLGTAGVVAIGFFYIVVKVMRSVMGRKSKRE